MKPFCAAVLSTFNKRELVVALFLGSAAAHGQDANPHPRWQPQVPGIGSKNMVPNSSFECGPAGWSSLGKETAWGGDLSSLFGKVVAEAAWHGTHCLRIDLGPGKTITTHFDAWPSNSVEQAAPLAGNVGWLAAEVGTTYTLSAYLRADGEAVPARLVARFGTNPLPHPFPGQQAQAVSVGTTWSRCSFTFTAEEPDVYIALGPDLSAKTGAVATMWIDAVQLERAPEATHYAPRELVEVGVYSGKLGNNFVTGEPVELTVSATNTTDAASTVTVTATLYDYFGNALPASSIEIPLPPHASITSRLPLNTNGKGFFRGVVHWENGGIRHQEPIVLSVVEPYPHDNSPFGINHAPTTAELAHLLQRSGIKWTRNTSTDWNELEPEQGRLSFQKSDRQIDREHAQGFKTLALMPLHPTSKWNSTAPEEVTSPGWVKLTHMPRDPQLLFKFVRKAVENYADRLRYYEFLNEPIWIPNAGANLSSGAGYKVEDYVRLLKEAYPVIKAADPDAVVLGGLSIQAEMPLGDKFIEQGGLKYCDIYTLHPYPMPSKAPEVQGDDLDRIRKVMDAHGGPKPIWATETGYFSEDDLPWQPWVAPDGHHSANNLTKNERMAADFSVRQAVVLLAHGVEKIFYHQGIEGEVNNGSPALDNPLLGPLATPEKFYPALAALANALGPAPVFAGRLQAREGVHAYAFTCGNEAVLVAWRTEETSPVSFRVRDGMRVENVMGNAETEADVALEVSPKYFRSNTLTAEMLLGRLR